MGNMQNEIDKILELMHGDSVTISKRYVYIYEKPTGYNSLDQMKSHIKDCNVTANRLIEEFNKKHNKDFFKDFYSKMEYRHVDGAVTLLKDALEYERQKYIKEKYQFKTIEVKTFDIKNKSN